MRARNMEMRQSRRNVGEPRAKAGAESKKNAPASLRRHSAWQSALDLEAQIDAEARAAIVAAPIAVVVTAVVPTAPAAAVTIIASLLDVRLRRLLAHILCCRQCACALGHCEQQANGGGANS